MLFVCLFFKKSMIVNSSRACRFLTKRVWECPGSKMFYTLCTLFQENVFVRLLNLPVVSCTCEVMGKTYNDTKQVHPLVSSVCEVYERGVRTAGNLAARGVRPAIDKLEPQRKLSVENRIAYYCISSAI